MKISTFSPEKCTKQPSQTPVEGELNPDSPSFYPETTLCTPASLLIRGLIRRDFLLDGVLEALKNHSPAAPVAARQTTYTEIQTPSGG